MNNEIFYRQNFDDDLRDLFTKRLREDENFGVEFFRKASTDDHKKRNDFKNG